MKLTARLALLKWHRDVFLSGLNMDPVQIVQFQNRMVRKPFEFDFIQRDASFALASQLKRREVTILLGARQTGKTSLIRRLIRKMETERPRGTILYMNMDSEELRMGFSSPVQLASYLQHLRVGKGDLLIIDEVQRLDQPGLYLKQLYDFGIGIKIIVSGSSSLEIRSKMREHLTGRRRTITLAPLTISELAAHRKLLPYPNDEDAKMPHPVCRAVAALAEEVAVFGGYPAVWGEEDPFEKARVISSIFETYVRRDVVEYLKVENVAGFNDLVRALSGQIGGLLNFAKLSGLVGIDVRTVKSYLEILEQTYVVHLVRPFSRNPRTEIRKSPKCPFADNGILNSSVGSFSPLGQRSDQGPLFENLVVSELAKRPGVDMRYWRTTSGAEVDVVLVFPGRVVPIEIKAAKLRRPAMTRGFRSFLAKYVPSTAYVLHRGEKMESTTGHTTVFFLPMYEALLLHPWENGETR